MGWGDNNYRAAEIIDIDPHYLEIGATTEERCLEYREDIDKIMTESFLDNIRKSLDRGVFGRQDFVESMKERFGIKSLNPVGRPKKNQS